MVRDIPPFVRYAVWAFMAGLLLAGAALLVAAATRPDPPTWWWWAGGTGAFLGGWFVTSLVRYRIRFPTQEARQENAERVIAARRARLEELTAETSRPSDLPTTERSQGGVTVFVGGLFLVVQFVIWFLAYTQDQYEPGWGGLVWTSAFGVIGAVLLRSGVRQVRRARRQAAVIAAVRTAGVRTTAVVTTLRQTRSGGEGGDPRVELGLRVSVPGHQPWQAATEYEVPVTLIPRIQPGAVLPVFADPAVPAVVVVDWPGLPEWSFPGDRA